MNQNHISIPVTDYELMLYWVHATLNQIINASEIIIIKPTDNSNFEHNPSNFKWLLGKCKKAKLCILKICLMAYIKISLNRSSENRHSNWAFP